MFPTAPEPCYTGNAKYLPKQERSHLKKQNIEYSNHFKAINKKRYTGYTVYNLKPKQFCVQKVSTVSTIGLQPILNPLSPRRGTTAPAWDDSRNCPPPGDFHAWEPWVLDGVRVLMLEVTHQKGFHCISMDFMGYMMD